MSDATPTNDVLADQIAAARAAAAALAPSAPAAPTPNVPANTAAASTAVGAVQKRLGLGDFMNSGNADADGFIKIGEAGVKFGKDLRGTQGVEVIINLAKDVRIFNVISYGREPAIYKRTSDNLTCVEGGTWDAAVRNAQSIDPKARIYESAELVFELKNDVFAGKDKLAEAGSRWAYSTPKTGSKKFRRMLNEALAQGIDIENDDILVKLGGEPKAGNGNQWAEITFELLGRASIDG